MDRKRGFGVFVTQIALALSVVFLLYTTHTIGENLNRVEGHFNSQWEHIEKKMVGVDESVLGCEGAVHKLQGQLSSLAKSFDDQSREVENSLATLKDRQAELERKIRFLQNKQTELETKAGFLEDKQTDLETKAEFLEDKQIELESSTKNLEKKQTDNKKFLEQKQIELQISKKKQEKKQAALETSTETQWDRIAILVSRIENLELATGKSDITQPAVTIIIPVLEEPTISPLMGYIPILKNLESLSVDPSVFEIIVVTTNAIHSISDSVKIVAPSLTTRATWSFYCDEGARAASGEYLMFLSPQTLVNENSNLFGSEWVELLKKEAMVNPKAAIFSPKVLDRKGDRSGREHRNIKVN
eukprot:TRINITY_DN5130_c0_g1_i1.p1 TRINITY_DN5130_c0_g1~~TRINITY_DN5130_c0_g1_i1.p1  ORF type:complete len:358 (-),score=91.07 TRINITY_DN5130_c0_g1_i1:15-1088(-)